MNKEAIGELELNLVVGEEDILEVMAMRGYRWTRIGGQIFMFSMNDVMRLRARGEWREIATWMIWSS